MPQCGCPIHDAVSSRHEWETTNPNPHGYPEPGAPETVLSLSKDLAHRGGRPGIPPHSMPQTSVDEGSSSLRTQCRHRIGPRCAKRRHKGRNQCHRQHQQSDHCEDQRIRSADAVKKTLYCTPEAQRQQHAENRSRHSKARAVPHTMTHFNAASVGAKYHGNPTPAFAGSRCKQSRRTPRSPPAEWPALRTGSPVQAQPRCHPETLPELVEGSVGHCSRVKTCGSHLARHATRTDRPWTNHNRHIRLGVLPF